MICLKMAMIFAAAGIGEGQTGAPAITAEPVPGQLEVMQGTAVKLGGAPSPDGPQPDSYHWEIVQGEGGTLYDENSYQVIFQSSSGSPSATPGRNPPTRRPTSVFTGTCRRPRRKRRNPSKM